MEVLRGFAEKNGISYSLLSDQGSVVIRRLGLLNEHIAAQSAVYGIQPRPEQEGIPYPGSFLLDESGVIVQKRFEQSYRERETGAGILEQGFGGRASTHGPEARGGSEGVQIRAFLDSPVYAYFQRLWLTVELTIERGLHVYGLPIPDGFIPLSVEVAPLEGLVVGEPSLPDPHPFRVQGLDEQFFVYEDAVSVALPITFSKREAGDQTLAVSVRYQVCSATDCLLPAAVQLELPVKAVALVPQ